MRYLTTLSYFWLTLVEYICDKETWYSNSLNKIHLAYGIGYINFTMGNNFNRSQVLAGPIFPKIRYNP